MAYVKVGSHASASACLTYGEYKDGERREGVEVGGVDADALARLHEDIGDFWAYILDGKKPQRESEPRRSAPMSAHGHGEQQAENVPHETSKAPICKGCGAVMRLCRRKQDGKPFWGCPNFRDSSVKHSVFDAEG